MTDTNKFYVTTPIYYGTAKPHLGSLYSTLLADIYARWNKIQGKKTFFLTGTDEHGQKVAHAADKAGKEPKAFVDSFISDYKTIWQQYEFSYDKFIRTTDADHILSVQKWIEKLQKQGDIYKSLYSGWYCTPCETYVTEDPAITVAPLCPSCNRETAQVSEECYFFKLSAYQEKLLQLYKDNPNFIVPKERAAEVVNFVQSGLRDLSISRTTISWGIPFPGDPKHVVYVWADALNNYVSAVGYGDETKRDLFNFWWPADMHIMGKDIVRFHAVYWPAFLMAAQLQLPKQLLVHGWIKVGEQKMSKSFGNVVDPQELYAAYGAEPVRYYLARHMAITHDSEFSIKDLEQRITSDLANDLGNLLNRMLTLAIKNNLSQVPVRDTWSDVSLELQKQMIECVHEFEHHMSEGMIHMALARLWKLINQINSYFHAQEPWKVVKVDSAKFAEIISLACHALYTIGILLWPVMPKKMESLLQQIGITIIVNDYNYVNDMKLDLFNKAFTLCLEPKPLFEKIEKEVVSEKQDTQAILEPSYITIDDVTKVELRVGTIEACVPVEKSDKLLQMRVNFGDSGMRTILAGIKKFYSPEDIIGKQALFVFNLKPRAMLGLESQGMMLLAKSGETLVIVSPQITVSDGTRLQ
jgi:methionyl-tRNA synthetase